MCPTPHSQGHHAAGILEGIRYYNFLDRIVIPNEPTEAEAAAKNGKDAEPDA